jgi:hypothetical protein
VILYTDMDETLIGPVRSPSNPDFMTDFIVRPWVGEFLRALAGHGDVIVLTAASKEWADQVLPELPGSDVIRGVVTREDLAPIADQMAVIESHLAPPSVRERLYGEVAPILPTGFMFDDFPVGSEMWRYKSLAAGIPDQRWIKVEKFTPSVPDRGGLEKAYNEFLKRSKAVT